MNNTLYELKKLQEKKAALEEEKKVLKKLHNEKIYQIEKIEENIKQLDLHIKVCEKNYKKYKKRIIKKFVSNSLQITGIFLFLGVGFVVIKNANIIDISLKALKLICGFLGASAFTGIGALIYALNDDINGLNESFIDNDIQDIDKEKQELNELKKQKTSELKILNNNLKDNNDRICNCINENLKVQQLFEPKEEKIEENNDLETPKKLVKRK